MSKTLLKTAGGISPAISNIQYRPPSDLKYWPNNARKHPAKQITALEASIKEFGFTNPALIDELNTILSGHGRVQAAINLGLEHIPVIVINGLTESQKRALVLADNKIAQLSSWDEALLRSEIELLIQSEIHIEVTGFTTAEADLMIGEPANESQKGADPDDSLPEFTSSPAICRLEDLWRLGDHQLLCGNALESECYGRLMRGDEAQMVFSDPPYNTSVNKVCGKGKIKHGEFSMASGEMSSAQFADFLKQASSCLFAVLQDGGIAFLCMDWRHMQEMLDGVQSVFGSPKQLCVWVKDNGGMGSFYRSQHELVFAFKKGKAKHINNFELGQHGRYRTNVWEYPGVNTFSGKGYEQLALHPTVKPVALVADAIRDCSHRKGIILDPFGGSGTTLIACERTGRYARVMELDPKYVDVAIQRWQRKTGKQAVLAETGQTWEEVCAERQSLTTEESSHGL